MSGRRDTGWGLRRNSRARPDDDAQAIDALQAEITLLREENSSLKAAQHQEAGLGKLLSHARALPVALDTRGETGDEAAQMLVEAMVIRQALLDTCGQIELSMAAVKSTLQRLGAEEQGAAPAANGSAQSLDPTDRRNREAS